MKHIEIIRQTFVELGHNWVDPVEVTIKEIDGKRGSVGNTRGLYFISPELNFYFGKAASGKISARMKSHQIKLSCDLKKIYGKPVSKKLTQTRMPQGWVEGISKHFLNNEIPEYFTRSNGLVHPIIEALEWKPDYNTDVTALPVLIWNLEHLTATQISELEESIISKLIPFCNKEARAVRLHSK